MAGRRKLPPASAIAGVGFGGGFRVASGWLSRWPASGSGAGVLSLLYIVSYLGLGVPAVVCCESSR